MQYQAYSSKFDFFVVAYEYNVLNYFCKQFILVFNS